tara:strand:+ start:258 stop:461 length:204 start_codon:yes stop_codon:yes gene_type:complete
LKKNDLNKLSHEELMTRMADGEESLLNLRFQKALQQLEHPLQIKHMKREIAQIKTVIREYELGKRGK